MYNNIKNEFFAGMSKNNVPVFYRQDTQDNHVHINEEDVSLVLASVEVADVPFQRISIDLHTCKSEYRDHLIERTDANYPVIMIRRGDRIGLTPMTIGKAPVTYEGLIVICNDEDHEGRKTIVTLLTGKQGMREPWDKNIRSEDERRQCQEFWDTHCLVCSNKDEEDEYWLVLEEQDAQLRALEEEFGDKLFNNEVISVMPTENELPF